MRTPLDQPKPMATSYSPPLPARESEPSMYFSNMRPPQSADLLRLGNLGDEGDSPPVVRQVQ
ncbi:hypothetical protein BD289DRAFT_420983 [Coniella lustricola]|uniref:Uncharacterized protein n=1 Tax=Coniella lustricola TaxID=2025994 RepID=A0A2T3AMY2_9PEZI|nr:hypothetical protein BD289DRAFT_420983 [Coniella lustricola]